MLNGRIGLALASREDRSLSGQSAGVIRAILMDKFVVDDRGG